MTIQIALVVKWTATHSTSSTAVFAKWHGLVSAVPLCCSLLTDHQFWTRFLGMTYFLTMATSGFPVHRFACAEFSIPWFSSTALCRCKHLLFFLNGIEPFLWRRRKRCGVFKHLCWLVLVFVELDFNFLSKLIKVFQFYVVYTDNLVSVSHHLT